MILLACTAIGLQTQLNELSVAAKRLGLIVNLEKSNVMVFRKGGFQVPEKDGSGMTRS